MTGAIYMMIYLCVMATVGGVYFYIKDLKEKKKR